MLLCYSFFNLKKLTSFIIGLCGGIFGGLLGLGGGIVMIPLMVLWMKLNQHKAHGTSLVAVVFIGFLGAVAYFLHGSVDWKVALLLAISATIMARYGALYAHSLTDAKLKKAFGFFIICMSIFLLGKGYVYQADFKLNWWARVIFFLATGTATGFLSGMMGIGGGAIMIPAMVIVTHMPQQLAQGTSLLAMVPVGIMGAYTHYSLGNVENKIVIGLIIGAAIGGYIGGNIANLLPELFVKLFFSAVLIWMGIHFIKSAR